MKCIDATKPSLACAAAGAVFAAAAVLASLEHWWLAELKFDDAYIHLRYVQNLLTGKGFVYNEGERVLGSAGVLWNLLLAGAAAVLPFQLPAIVSAINCAALLGAALCAAAFLRQFVPTPYALVAGAALLISGPLVTASIGGMETSLLGLLLLSGYYALPRYPLAAAAAAGAALCIRIEAFPLLIAVAAGVWMRNRDRSLRPIACAFALPLFVFVTSWLYFGSPIANSTQAKRIIYALPPGQALVESADALRSIFAFDQLVPGLQFWPDVARWTGLALWAAVLTAGYLRMKRVSGPAALIVLQAVLPFLFYAVTNPFMFPWYFATFAPAATLVAFAGIYELVSRIRVVRSGRQGALAILIAGGLSVGPVRSTWFPLVSPGSASFSFQLPNARECARTFQYRNVARWLNLRAGPNDRVCISEIGAFGYHFHGRILDGVGLVSPEVLRYHPMPSGSRPSGAIGAIPPAAVRDLRPEFVVSLDVFAESVFADPWFRQNYRPIGEWPWFGGPVRWHDLPDSLWGGKQIRAFRRVDVPWAEE